MCLAQEEALSSTSSILAHNLNKLNFIAENLLRATLLFYCRVESVGRMLLFMMLIFTRTNDAAGELRN